MAYDMGFVDEKPVVATMIDLFSYVFALLVFIVFVAAIGWVLRSLSDLWVEG